MGDGLLFERMQAAVTEGDADRARALAEEALRAGLDPIEVLERGYTSALRTVGDGWARGDVYLPEMMLSAEAVKAALHALTPALRARSAPSDASALCVLGTVQGDIHDIGKNIVGTLLEAFGFLIVDLGTDVAPERFVAAVRETGAGLVGLSALLTSTMPGMKAVLDALEEAGLRSRVRVAVGGAPITPAFARDIGADGFAEDGVSALRLFQSLAAAPAGGPAAGTAAGAMTGEARHAL